MKPAIEALERLRAGNLRFASGERRTEALPNRERVRELVSGQNPFAVILGCSDSRVPVELIFDKGLGDLFVIRIAGNIVAPSQIGSIEFAVEKFGTPLVVILGHSGCGAVEATLEQIQRPVEQQSGHLHSIVKRIRPAVEPLLSTNLVADPAALMRKAVRANVRAAANQLRHGSDFLESLVQDGDLWVLGAEYSLETGKVDFFDGLP